VASLVWFDVLGSDWAADCDSADLLKGNCGCAHGGVGCVTEASVCGCVVAFEGLTSPVLVLFLPDMLVLVLNDW
jgi:hypothetical protein